MRVFIYEFVTGGGLYATGESIGDSRSLLSEGTAMVRAIAADFRSISGCQVVVLRDKRLNADILGVPSIPIASKEEEFDAIHRQAAAADFCLVIAPESSGILATRVRWFEECNAKLLSPNSRFCDMAADKSASASYLSGYKIPVPAGRTWLTRDEFPGDIQFPAVLKPFDGAGSIDTILLNEPIERCPFSSRDRWRLERYQPGISASVSVIFGTNSRWILPACEQRLTSDGRFRYQGGRIPLELSLANRAQNLAEKTAAVLPKIIGYVGIDIVLGSCPDGTDDCVIELNPRLTTSYVGLRAALKANLALAMLQLERGEMPELPALLKKVEFDAGGTVRLGEL